MGWIGCIHCENLWCDFVARTSSLIALVQSVFHQVSSSNKTNPKCNQIVRNKQILEFRVQWGGSGAFVAKKIQCDSMAQTCPLIAPVQHILHPDPCSNEILPKAPKHYENAPKHEFRVQWGGSRAFVAKNSDAISWHKLCINCTSSSYFAPSFMQ